MTYHSIHIDDVYPIKSSKLWPRCVALAFFAGVATYTVYTAMNIPSEGERYFAERSHDCEYTNEHNGSDADALRGWHQRDFQRLYYNRVPKCGSTTFINLMRKLSVMHRYVHFHSKIYDKRYLDEEEQRRIVHFLKNTPPPCSFDRHVFFINFTKFGEKPPIYINVIRDPVETIISSFFYRRKVAVDNLNKSTTFKPKPSSYWLNKKFEHCVLAPDPECTFIDGKNYSVMQLPYFCGQDSQCQFLNDPIALQKAKYNIDRAYTVVGILEHMNVTLSVLETLLPQFFGGVFQLYQKIDPHFNRNIQKQHVSQEVKDILRTNLTAEYELYEFTLKRLYNQYKNIASETFKKAQGIEINIQQTPDIATDRTLSDELEQLTTNVEAESTK